MGSVGNIVLIKITNIMMKAAPREPIHLAHLRKRPKHEPLPLPAPTDHPNDIQYDLHLFQESLNIHKHTHEQNTQEPIEGVQLIGSKEEDSSEHSLHHSLAHKHTNGHLPDRLRELALDRASLPRNLISSEAGHYSSIHKAKACFKPKTSQIQNKENVLAQLPRNQHTKTNHIATACNLKSEVLREIKNAHQNNATIQLDQLAAAKQAYEAKIRELQLKNEEAERKIQALEVKLKEREEMATRVDQIEKDLNLLYEQNRELHRMNESLSKHSLLSEEHQSFDAQTQTDVFPLYVCDFFCQTPSLDGGDRSQLSLVEKELLSNAAVWKEELEWERQNAKKREDWFRNTMDVMQAEHRQQVHSLHSQLQQTAHSKHSQQCSAGPQLLRG